MVRVLVLVAGGAMLFVAGLVGTLGLRGKLNAESLNSVLGREEIEAPAADDPAAAGVASAPGTGATEVAVPPAAESPALSQASLAGPLAAISIGSPFSDDETRELFRELRSARAETIEGRAVLDRERRDLELVRMDLNRRWDEVEQREQETQEYARSLEAQRAEMESRSLMLRDAEADNLQQFAKSVEKMAADSAARLLQEHSPERAALILHHVKPRETGKILDAMPQAYAAQVAEKMLGILKPEENQSKGGQ